MKRLLPILFIFILASAISAQSDSSSVCPSISLVGPEGLTRLGEQIIVKATLSPNNLTNLKYIWLVDKGKIKTGQDCPEIVIDTSDINEARVPRAIEIGVKLTIANSTMGCQNTASEKYGVFVNYDVFPLDEYGKISLQDEKARLDNLAIQVSASGDNRYIIMHFAANISKSEIEKKIHQIEYFMFSLRKYRKERFRIIVKRDDKTFTQLWRLPSGVEPPID